jgi:hypothetical protein
MRILLLFALSILAGCAINPKRDANELTAADQGYVASQIASYVADALPVASSSVALSVPIAEGADTPDPVALALRERGFAVFDSGLPDSAAGSHALSYTASMLDSGLLILVTLDGQLTSRFYERDSTGQFSPVSAYSRRLNE